MLPTLPLPFRRFSAGLVALIPEDDERSFGVWRMMSGKRMYPAYHVTLAMQKRVEGKEHFDHLLPHVIYNPRKM